MPPSVRWWSSFSLASSCSTARRIQLEGDRSSAAARARTFAGEYVTAEGPASCGVSRMRGSQRNDQDLPGYFGDHHVGRCRRRPDHRTGRRAAADQDRREGPGHPYCRCRPGRRPCLIEHSDHPETAIGVCFHGRLPRLPSNTAMTPSGISLFAGSAQCGRLQVM